MRWKSNKNITNDTYLYDKHNNRQYWLNDEAYIIACIMNTYESRIEELEEYIDSKRWGSIPTRFDHIIDSITHKFKRKFMSIIDRDSLKQGDGWRMETIEEFDGIKYKVTLQVMEVE